MPVPVFVKILISIQVGANRVGGERDARRSAQAGRSTRRR
jgi:hypothetical protein